MIEKFINSNTEICVEFDQFRMSANRLLDGFNGLYFGLDLLKIGKVIL